MAEFIISLAFLGMVGAVTAFVLDYRKRRSFKDRLGARWRILVESADGFTCVYVYRDVDSTVMDRICVARVPHEDPDWRSKVQSARAEAQERVATLEASE